MLTLLDAIDKVCFKSFCETIKCKSLIWPLSIIAQWHLVLGYKEKSSITDKLKKCHLIYQETYFYYIQILSSDKRLKTHLKQKKLRHGWKSSVQIVFEPFVTNKRFCQRVKIHLSIHQFPSANQEAQYTLDSTPICRMAHWKIMLVLN